MAQIPPWSLLLLVIGALFAIWPRHITTAYEVIDAIGRRPAGSVEPAEWYVSLTRIGGIAFIIIGIGGIIRAVG